MENVCLPPSETVFSDHEIPLKLFFSSRHLIEIKKEQKNYSNDLTLQALLVKFLEWYFLPAAR